MSIQSTIKNFAGLKVLIVGDVMVDSYIFGQVDRISPEAPVPVINVSGKEDRLGGAANVAMNIAALAATPLLCTVIGNDDEGTILLDLLKSKHLSSEAIVRSKDRLTTTKTRIVGNKHQLVRVDREMSNPLNDYENAQLIHLFESMVPDCDVVILEDYNKGVLNENNIGLIIALANKYQKPIAVDPKKNNFLSFRKVTLFKPNLKEIKEGLNITHDLSDMDKLKEAILQMNGILHNTYTMVTLSEKGVLITDHSNFYHIPAHVRNISDVSGAGDTVISVISLALAGGVDIKQAAELANLAGGLVCEETGVVPINREKLLREAIEKDLHTPAN